MNRTILIGRLTKNPELRKSQSGNSIVNFTLAVDNGKDKNGEKTTLFIDVVCFNATADNVAKYTSKGTLIAVDGKLHQRTYETKDGRKVNVIEVYADSVQFLETKKVKEEVEEDEEVSPTNDDVSDDDLPF